VFYLDVAYVAVVIICCKHMFPNISSVSDVCCSKCFMLSVFISKHRKQAQVEAVPACLPNSMACMHSSMACVGVQQQAHAEGQVVAVCATAKAACTGAQQQVHCGACSRRGR
jgi:hypothetical protein